MPMKTARTAVPVFKAHVAALVAMTLAVVFLIVTYMRVELVALRSLALLGFLVLNSLSNLLGGLALKRIGHSPWLGLTGFAMGLVPLILYLMLPVRFPAED